MIFRIQVRGSTLLCYLSHCTLFYYNSSIGAQDIEYEYLRMYAYVAMQRYMRIRENAIHMVKTELLHAPEMMVECPNCGRKRAAKVGLYVCSACSAVFTVKNEEPVASADA